METKPSPYRKFVCVCTNTRDDGRPACANSGKDNDAVWTSLKEGVARLGLKGQVRVTRSGCLGLCEHGPNILSYPEGRWHSKVSPSDVPALLKELDA